MPEPLTERDLGEIRQDAECFPDQYATPVFRLLDEIERLSEQVAACWLAADSAHDLLMRHMAGDELAVLVSKQRHRMNVAANLLARVLRAQRAPGWQPDQRRES